MIAREAMGQSSKGGPHASAHLDQFAREQLPPLELWPRIEFTLPDIQYSPRLNAATVLLELAQEVKHATRPVIRFPGGEWTYVDLLERSNRIAHVLVDQYG